MTTAGRRGRRLSDARSSSSKGSPSTPYNTRLASQFAREARKKERVVIMDHGADVERGVFVWRQADRQTDRQSARTDTRLDWTGKDSTHTCTHSSLTHSLTHSLVGGELEKEQVHFLRRLPRLAVPQLPFWSPFVKRCTNARIFLERGMLECLGISRQRASAFFFANCLLKGASVRPRA